MSALQRSPKPRHTGHQPVVRIGFIPLVDCAPLLLAAALDLFSKHGVRVELSCEVGWATVREKILYGQLAGAHSIAGLALAMRMGLTLQCQVVAPFVMNLHGNAITLSRDLWNRGVRDARTLQMLIRSHPSRRVTLGMVSRYSAHYFILRRWLASGGIDADVDLRVVALPPTQMAANLAAGLIDGYCVGEPWNSIAVESNAGWIVATSEDLAPSHPEKVLLLRQDFIEQQHDQALAVIAALSEAATYCDLPDNRELVVKLLANTGYFNGLDNVLRRSLVGPLDLGAGRRMDPGSFHVFHRREANVPLWERGLWLLNEFISHGLLRPEQRPEATQALSECWDATLLREAVPAPAAVPPPPPRAQESNLKANPKSRAKKIHTSTP